MNYKFQDAVQINKQNYCYIPHFHKKEFILFEKFYGF